MNVHVAIPSLAIVRVQTDSRIGINSLLLAEPSVLLTVD